MSEIQIKVKFTKGGVIKDFTILSDMFVDDLRIIIEEEFKIPPYRQNLIFKGKMLQNEKKLEDYKISNNDLILLVEKVGESGDKTGLNNITGQSGVGARGQINYDLLKHPMGMNGDISQVVEAMKIPEIAGQMDTILDDPNVMNAMMQNPQIKAMCDMNPNIKNLLQNKEFIKSMLQPENLERIQRISEGTANISDLMGVFNFRNNNNENNNNQSNNNNNNTLNNPFGMFGMPMGNPFLMNPSMMRMPNLFGPGFGNNNFNNNFNNNLNNNTMLTQEQLKEKYKEQISKIKEMGFPNEDEIIKALQKTNGNIDAAIERLISGIN